MISGAPWPAKKEGVGLPDIHTPLMEFLVKSRNGCNFYEKEAAGYHARRSYE